MTPPRTRAKPKPEAESPRIVGYDAAFPLAELNPFHKNPRRGDIPTIRESLRKTGQYRPIVVNQGELTGRPNEILAGNHTYAAAQAEGWDRIAVTWVNVDESTAARIVVIDNRASDKAKNDVDQLAELLGDLEGDLEGSGYSEDELAKLLNPDGGGDLDEVFATRFELVVECQDEADQAELYERLSGEGLTVRVLSM